MDFSHPPYCLGEAHPATQGCPWVGDSHHSPGLLAPASGQLSLTEGVDFPESQVHPKAPLLFPRTSKALQTQIGAASELSQQSLPHRGGTLRVLVPAPQKPPVLLALHGQAIKHRHFCSPASKYSAASPTLGILLAPPGSPSLGCRYSREQPKSTAGREKQWQLFLSRRNLRVMEQMAAFFPGVTGWGSSRCDSGTFPRP